MRSYNIGIMGLGTVGGSTYDILTKNKDLIVKRTGIDYEIRRVLEIKEENIRRHGVDHAIVTSDPDEVIKAGDLDIVLEAIGGSEPVSTWMVTAMEHGISVVTPNKAAIASQYDRFLNAAAENGVQFRYEASVGGGIPELTAITEQLAGNRFTQISGIVNGTTNYILTRMGDAGMTYEEALKDAQSKGFAEADPTADVEGIDCANKLTILMKLCFDRYIKPQDIPRTGITHITKSDLDSAREKGCRLKLIVRAALKDDGSVDCSVAPEEIPAGDLLANVNNEFNAISVTGDAAGEVMFYGKGAGPATGSAIVGDIIHIMRDLSLSGK